MFFFDAGDVSGNEPREQKVERRARAMNAQCLEVASRDYVADRGTEPWRTSTASKLDLIEIHKRGSP